MARLKSELSPEDYAKLEGMMWILGEHKKVWGNSYGIYPYHQLFRKTDGNIAP